MCIAVSTVDELLAPETPTDAAVAEGLIARAFGPGRFAKAVERLRERGRLDRETSFIAWRGEEAVGCVRLWPVSIGGKPGLLLGPIAVDDSCRRQGVGADLVTRACEAAAAAGWAYVVLVGDKPFFGPLGFSAAPARDVRLPGPVDQTRVMVRALVPGGDDNLAGPVVPLA
ncbi:MAG TPA: N-acetyltransferase [Caulobacteraceae bacterium]|nr:N-acetyltransferase [Caulobacteraceae bacterium]